jgi:hypothetical protein
MISIQIICVENQYRALIWSLVWYMFTYSHPIIHQLYQIFEKRAQKISQSFINNDLVVL